MQVITLFGIQQLESVAYVPAEVIAENRREHWDKNIFVIPEYSFAFECDSDPILSNEHTEYKWLTYDKAQDNTLYYPR